MPQLIKDADIVNDEWLLLPEDVSDKPLSPGKLIVSLKTWLDRTGELAGRADIGVWIEGDADLSEVAPAIVDLPVIAIRFPGFMDGRGFSAARLLRERYGFKGELRAIGHFIRDQLCYLRRCGFSSFQFADDENLEVALTSLNDFQQYYQAAVDQLQPLFRRRSA